ncbi:phosphotransferase [Actinosynnema sp. NPDC023587]|uniref:phosphotransferase n=1 Tax=Actinosynnema sp. NPDC023587 TaxID=3154695 RepID=UPI0033C5B748
MHRRGGRTRRARGGDAARREPRGWLRRPAESALGEVPGVVAARFDRIADALDTADATAVHGDFHSQNVHPGPTRPALLDFQFAQRASGTLDLASWNFGIPPATHLRAMKAQGRDRPTGLPILARCLAAVEDRDALALVR